MKKIFILLLAVVCISPLFADADVMVPTVSPEHFRLLDQITQMQLGLLPRSNETKILQELKKLSEKDTLAAIRYAMLIERENKTVSNKIWKDQFSALQQLAKKSNLQACLWLSTAYRFGNVVERNSETASEWRKKYFALRQAALLKDDPYSMLEELVITLQKQSEPDIKFTELLKKLQKNGSKTATERLKRMEKNGK